MLVGDGVQIKTVFNKFIRCLAQGNQMNVKTKDLLRKEPLTDAASDTCNVLEGVWDISSLCAFTVSSTQLWSMARWAQCNKGVGETKGRRMRTIPAGGQHLLSLGVWDACSLSLGVWVYLSLGVSDVPLPLHCPSPFCHCFITACDVLAHLVTSCFELSLCYTDALSHLFQSKFPITCSLRSELQIYYHVGYNSGLSFDS